jgi:hypothetical protein
VPQRTRRAAIYSPTTRTTKEEYIATDYTHNVYAAELTAIQMVLTLVEENIDEYNNVYLHRQPIRNQDGRIAKASVRTIHYRGNS